MIKFSRQSSLCTVHCAFRLTLCLALIGLMEQVFLSILITEQISWGKWMNFSEWEVTCNFRDQDVNTHEVANYKPHLSESCLTYFTLTYPFFRQCFWQTPYWLKWILLDWLFFLADVRLLQPWILNNTRTKWYSCAAHLEVTVQYIQYVLSFFDALFPYVNALMALHVYWKFSLITSWPSDPQQGKWQPCKSSWLNALFGAKCICHVLMYAPSISHQPPPSTTFHIGICVCFYGNRSQYGNECFLMFWTERTFLLFY